MFEQCRAFVAAPSFDECGQLEYLAEKLGFGDVASSRAGAGPLRAGVTFFLLHQRLADETMRELIEVVRTERGDNLCYSPIILLIDDTRTDTVLKYVRLGFDDVVAIPERRDVLTERLGAQLYGDQVYFQTRDYLGPDRRRMEVSDAARQGRSTVSAHTRLMFRRDPEHGIRIINREIRGQRTQMARPQPSTHFMPKAFPRVFGHSHAAT